VAEQERKTKAERREEKRQRRMEEEAAAEAAARRAKYRNGGIAIALVVVLGGLGYLAVGNQTPTIDNAITVSQAEVEEARTSSGCEVLDIQPLGDNSHLQPTSAPPQEALYTNGRPTATGQHYTNQGPIFSGVRDEQLDERSTTHNLEHGSVIVWFDPEQVSDDAIDEIDGMVARLNDAGFESPGGGAGILASPFTDPGIDSGKAIAIRSWAQGMDCDEWDIDYAYGWIAQHFGTRGPAPEGAIGQYPEDVLEISDADGGANEPTSDDTGADEPTSDETGADDPTAEPTDGATGDTSDDPTAEPTDAATADDEG